MAPSGYGKRSIPEQPPLRRSTYAHLPPREASVATHLDRLPDGAAVDIKTLAKELPSYGQQAISTALKTLSAAGHLRRFRVPVGNGRTQWVQRTYFSRGARDDAWWAAFAGANELTGAGPGPTGEVAPPPPWVPEIHPAGATAAGGPGASGGAVTPPPTVPDPRPGSTPAAAATGVGPYRIPGPRRSEAYNALAALGQRLPRLTLSAAECADLEPLAALWLARGADTDQLTQSLTSGVPDHVHSPAAFTRQRLTAKLPPERAAGTAPGPRAAARLTMECTVCGRPGRPETLPGGLCGTCRAEPGVAAPSRSEAQHLNNGIAMGDVLAPVLQDVHSQIARLRAACGKGAVPAPAT